MSKNKVEQAVELAELEQDELTEEHAIKAELSPEERQEAIDELKAQLKKANAEKDYQLSKKLRRTLRKKHGYYISKDKPEVTEEVEETEE